ncbi:uncharacterized protein TRAVEDRAFT_121182 [Trametes versicolor FP-101664 SS1]|uniref:uncharacterized protein n=1 Tax=Trametes versicolor (strain FP-101664) TaxID=717944 RepID=UPI0004623A1D|nr:uncharacterized protein TRAVEDRAFT_121182 [Trametes versicolor FP-101664 SS1]EIW59759.1 hypothetical protein TRAVEDRAFT_121182 [Trametes versicolor FP-101664 SS1]
MKGTGEDDSDSTRLPTKEELRDFNPSFGRCCTADNFRPDLVGMPHTPWNLSVAEVFAEEFIKQKVHPCRDEVAIKKNFLRHLGYLQQRSVTPCIRRPLRTKAPAYHHIRHSDAGGTARGRSHAQSARTCTASPSMTGVDRHFALLTRLSPSNMSGDETEAAEATRRTYRIIKARWQSAALRTFLRALDAKRRDLWENPPQPRLWWNAPRIRVESANSEEDGRAPIGLWRNCYDEEWLQALKPEQREALEVVDEDYNFDWTVQDAADEA